MKFLSTKESADYLNVHENSIRKWIKSGKLTAYKVGKDYRINVDDLQRFVEKGKCGV